MSIRMRESVYMKFRMLCEEHRRPNGDMLRIMMEAFVRSLQKAGGQTSGYLSEFTFPTSPDSWALSFTIQSRSYPEKYQLPWPP